MIRAKIRIRPVATIRRVDVADGDVDTEFIQFARPAHDELTALGFEAGPLLRVMGTWETVEQFLAAYQRPSDGQQANVSMHFGIGVAGRRARPGYVEFGDTFRGGVSVCTVNISVPLIVPDGADEVIVQAPHIRSLATLLMVHKEACRQHGPGRPKRDAAEGWAERMVTDSVARVVRRGVEHGHMRALGDGNYGYTWKGAFFMAYRILPPWMNIVRARTRACANKLERTAIATVPMAR